MIRIQSIDLLKTLLEYYAIVISAIDIVLTQGKTIQDDTRSCHSKYDIREEHDRLLFLSSLVSMRSSREFALLPEE